MPLLLAAAALLVVALASRGARARTNPAPLSLPNCRTDYTAHLLDGRKRQPLRLIVLHSTESNSALSAAGWFVNPDSEGSAHIIVGEDDCFRTLPDEADAAGANDVNPYALHIEFTGWAARPREWWLTKIRTLTSGRAIVHNWSRLYGIPLRRLSLDELRAIKAGNPTIKGVTTHKDLVTVFGGRHADPGPGFPVDVILS